MAQEQKKRYLLAFVVVVVVFFQILFQTQQQNEKEKSFIPIYDFFIRFSRCMTAATLQLHKRMKRAAAAAQKHNKRTNK